ncbi:hypothetical protein AT15_08985 [Kosmotoga arenicorallina S304]|uniref:Protein-L-isoaspartate O-methyltransferase n=1 Tax=Kosmotoga arenicorallina S304 TaxID=1453497 RepID=A0A176K252_9BACT|nr:methyltransferase domain-containing protein [Kosmotoga arenicorallina]OAA31100.1 hypothetical protein AT15_08985 [Kosmotoga arenicorallina S304]
MDGPSKVLADELNFMGILKDKRLYDAVCKINRRDFVLPKYRAMANYDRVLPSWEEDGKVVSTSTQPSLAIEMIKLLKIPEKAKILDIGTGTGYATAIMATAYAHVSIVSIEWLPSLVEIALENFRKYGISNVKIHSGDGYIGCKEQAPFDRIISMVAPSDISPFWFKQLEVGGILVSPIFVNSMYTPVITCEKTSKRELICKKSIDAVFIPMEQHTDNSFSMKISEMRFELSGNRLIYKSFH